MVHLADASVRLHAMRQLLEAAGESDRPDLSKTQTESFLATLKLLTLDKKPAGFGEEAKKWMKAIGEMTHWLRAEDHELMINEIADAMVTRKIGWRLQNCKSILSFLSNADWDNWFDRPTWTKCQRILFNKAVILDCGHPCEQSTRLWVSALHVATHSMAEIEAIPSSTMQAEHKKLKAAFQSYVGKGIGSNAANKDLKDLPSTPEELQVEDGVRYRKAFPEGSASPVICRLDLIEVDRVTRMFSCRGGSFKFQSASFNLSVADDHGQGQNERLAAMMLQGFQRMQQQNMEMMQRFMGSKPRFALEDDARAEGSGIEQRSEQQPRSPAETVNSNLSRGASFETASAIQSSPAPDLQKSPEPRRDQSPRSALRMMKERAQSKRDAAAAGPKPPTKAMKAMKAMKDDGKKLKGAQAGPKPVIKKPAAADSAFVKGKKLPKGWSCICPYPGRKDKIYKSHEGKQFRSMLEVNRYYGKPVF